MLSNLMPVKKRKEKPRMPKQPNPDPSAKQPLPIKGVSNLLRFRTTKELQHKSVINITLCIPSGKVTDLVAELMFDGLDILCAEDKSVCFVHLKDFEQQ
jgi:hypothetical protein